MKLFISVILNFVGGLFIFSGLMLCISKAIGSGICFFAIGLVLLSPIRRKLAAPFKKYILGIKVTENCHKNYMMMGARLFLFTMITLSIMGILMYIFDCHHEWKDATCTSPRICKKCSIEDGEALGHNVSSWTIIKKSTCTSEGVKQGACLRCKKRIEKSTNKLKHTWKAGTKIPATCIKVGQQTFVCIVCNEEKNEELPKTEHNIKEKIIQKPTCSEPGIKKQICDTCGKETSEELPVVDHNMKWKIVKKSTFENDGKKIKTCTMCGKKGEEKVIPSYISQYKEYEYEQLVRYPNDFYGKKIKSTGTVYYIAEGEYESFYMMYLIDDMYEGDDIKFYPDTMTVRFSIDTSKGRILEGDKITFYGTYVGIADNVNYPSILADYAKLVK